MFNNLAFEEFEQGQSAQSAELALLSDFDIPNDKDFLLDEDFLNWKECVDPEIIKTLLPSKNDNVNDVSDRLDNPSKFENTSSTRTSTTGTSNTSTGSEKNNSITLIQNKIKRDRSRSAYRLPKVPKNDIRRYFANMLMNTLNSGEFIHAQNFFQTFMTPTCRFSTTQILPAEVQLPLQVGGNGPAVFAHYFLGLHMMFPDIILTMTNPKVVTFGQSNCTRIVADLECNYTKTSHIPLELWIPPENLLQELYAAQTLEEITMLLKGTGLEDTMPSNQNSATESDLNTIEGTAGSGSTNTVTTENLYQQQQQQQTEEEEEEEGDGSGESASVLQKRKHSANTASPGSPSPSPEGNRYIPLQFIGQLAQAAQPLGAPISLRTLGQLDIVMDENKHIVSMALRSHYVEVT